MNCLPCLKGYPTNLYQDVERVMHSSRASSSSTSSHHRLREQQQGMETLRQACTQIAGVKPQGGSDTEVVFESSPQSSSGGTSTSSGRLREQSRMMEQVKLSVYITRRQRVLIIYHLLDVSHDATRNSRRFKSTPTDMLAYMHHTHVHTHAPLASRMQTYARSRAHTHAPWHRNK